TGVVLRQSWLFKPLRISTRSLAGSTAGKARWAIIPVTRMANPSVTALRKEKPLGRRPAPARSRPVPSLRLLIGILFFVWRDDARTKGAVQGVNGGRRGSHCGPSAAHHENPPAAPTAAGVSKWQLNQSGSNSLAPVFSRWVCWWSRSRAPSGAQGVDQLIQFVRDGLHVGV